MTRQRLHSNLGELDVLTRNELSEELAKHADLISRIQSRTIKLMKLPIISAQAKTTSLLLTNTGNQAAPTGPDSGFLWMLRRVLITSSGGYTAPIPGTLPTAQSQTASVATPAGSGVIVQLTLPATTVPVVWTLNWSVGIVSATATLPNNFELTGGTSTFPSNNGVAIGTYSQLPQQYLQPAGGAHTISVLAVAAEATATYTASLSLIPTSQVTTVGAGDLAQVSYLYVGSDTSQNQNTIIDGVNVFVGEAYYPGSQGAWVFPGEQIYAALEYTTPGNTYTLTGVAIEVAAEELAKLIQ